MRLSEVRWNNKPVRRISSIIWRTISILSILAWLFVFAMFTVEQEIVDWIQTIFPFLSW